MIDSACTHHICNDQKSFEMFTPEDAKVIDVNNTETNSQRFDVVALQSNVDGKKLPTTLKNVLYSPNIM